MSFSSVRAIVALLAVAVHVAPAQDADKIFLTVDASKAFQEIAPLPRQIREASGLEMTEANSLWTHNDGGTPVLFKIDTAGRLKGTLQLNHPNSGWEDLTADHNGNLYIGAFGNNNNDRKDLRIYRIENPGAISEPVYTAAIIRFRYADQHAWPPPADRKNYDADAFVAAGDSLYIFSKNRTQPFTGYTRIYRLPQVAGDYVAEAIDSIYLGKGQMIDQWVTSADLSPDGKTLALSSHRWIWIITSFTGNRFSSGKIVRVNLNHFSHKAGICFTGNNRLFIVDEIEFGMWGGKLYSLDLSRIFRDP